ncbi:MAG: TonB-dependent receptor [Deltaproteobacteria bacterium]|nr:TonB-dependent receptor [Deltaproteobacteria bacterium]
MPWLAVVLGVVLGARAEDAPPASALPEEDVPPAEEVVVEDAWSRVRPGQRVITDEEVDRAGSLTLAQALERDVAVTASCGARGERQFSVRGFDQKQVAVLVDGVPTSVPYNGFVDLGKFPAAMLEEARILPGASAGLYGPVSLGGAVEIRTAPPPDRPQAWARTRMAWHGAVETDASAGGGRGPLAVRVAGGARSTPGTPLSASFEPTSREDGGTRDASNGRSSDLRTQARWDLGRGGRISLGANYVTGVWSVPTGLYDYPIRYWRYTDFHDLGTSLRHEAAVGRHLIVEESAFYLLNQNVLDAYDDVTRLTQEETGSWHSLYQDDRVGGVAQATAALGDPDDPWARVRARFFLDRQHHHSVPDRGEPAVDISTVVWSGALSAERPAGRAPGGFAGLEVDGEVPVQDAAFTPAPTFVGPVAGLRWSALDRVDLEASVARRARFPTLKERFSSARGYRLPNVDLGPERAWHMGLDAAIRVADPLAVGLSLWDAEVEDLIEEVVLDGGEVQLQNVGRAEIFGGEGGLRILPVETLTLDATGAFLRARRRDADPPDDRLEYRPAWQSRVTATWLPGGRWEAEVTWQAVGPQSFYEENLGQWGTLGWIDTWDAGLGYRPVRTALVRLQVQNVLDAHVQLRYGYPDPGRTVWCTVEIGG